MKKWLSVFLTVLLAAGLLAGCAKKTTGTPEVVLKIGVGSDPGTFDPQNATTATPQYPINQAYRGLFCFDANGKLVNALCKSYEVSPDGLTYTFYLREDAKWSDGVAVKAKDFVYGWERNFVPALLAGYGDLFDALVNYDDVVDEVKPLSALGVEAVNDNTLKVSLTRTQPYFISMTTFSPFFPVREDKVPNDSTAWSVQPNLTGVVTSGPFKFESYSANEKIVLVRNDLYYDKDLVSIDKIE